MQTLALSSFVGQRSSEMWMRSALCSVRFCNAPWCLFAIVILTAKGEKRHRRRANLGVLRMRGPKQQLPN